MPKEKFSFKKPDGNKTTNLSNNNITFIFQACNKIARLIILHLFSLLKSNNGFTSSFNKPQKKSSNDKSYLLHHCVCYHWCNRTSAKILSSNVRIEQKSYKLSKTFYTVLLFWSSKLWYGSIGNKTNTSSHFLCSSILVYVPFH